jgi:O-methyltransferase
LRTYYVAPPHSGDIDIASLLENCNVIAFSDSATELWGTHYCGLPVIPPNEIIKQNYDYIYILSMMSYEAIERDLITKYNVPPKKIISDPVRLYNLTRKRFVNTVAKNLAKRGITGSVAEGGVFRGAFAEILNAEFSGSKLYLFDTFEGFDNRDTKNDSTFAKQENTHSHLADTSVQIVLDRLPHPEQAIIRKGYFPETAKGVEDSFVFVNLDFDLYAPIKAGLEFFFPKMLNGGVILVHDYFNSNFDARKAVDEFCEANDVYALPIGDLLSVVIVKQ